MEFIYKSVKYALCQTSIHSTRLFKDGLWKWTIPLSLWNPLL